MRFGILQRYVFGEVFRAFFLALLTITGIFVLFMVMAEAARKGLTPGDMAHLVPLILPTSLPYTVPVALLFAVTLVFGRLAADNEVIAVKTAGVSAWTILAPSVALGFLLGGLLAWLSQDLIPRSNHLAVRFLFSNIEDNFYKILKKERAFDNAQWPFFIRVKDVEGKTMLGAIFKHRAKGALNPNAFDLTVTAKRARVRFDIRKPPEKSWVRVLLEGSESQGSTDHPDVFLIDGKVLEYPIPDGTRLGTPPPRIQELTFAEIAAEQAGLREKIARERKLQAISAGLWIASGRIDRVLWPAVDLSFREYARWQRELHELETEKHMRMALGWGSLFFVLLGAPVGILFAKRDFLSAFITCFVPIITIYYPLTLAGVNLGKDGLMNPIYAVWAGNAILGLLAGFLALPPVIKR